MKKIERKLKKKHIKYNNKMQKYRKVLPMFLTMNLQSIGMTIKKLINTI